MSERELSVGVGSLIVGDGGRSFIVKSGWPSTVAAFAGAMTMPMPWVNCRWRFTQVSWGTLLGWSSRTALTTWVARPSIWYRSMSTSVIW